MTTAELLQSLTAVNINDWDDIENYLQQLSMSGGAATQSTVDFECQVSRGIAFITYDFGIDGVSIEIFKYADCLEKLFKSRGYDAVPMHFIGGDFHEKADIVLKPYWQRFQIDNMNGWNKWYGGKYFSKLYYEDMPEGSEQSREMAREMWRQAGEFAAQLGDYLEKHQIKLLIPVNIPTNPGNFAIMLAIVMVTEALQCSVISSNHDFYWEGGAPPEERHPGAEPGVRDHFFRNCHNRPFFKLFQLLYPWNGRRWIQVNINSPQSRTLIEKFGFPPNKVFELGTSISDKFFQPGTSEYVNSVRRRMNYIISDGSELIETIDIKRHLAGLSDWMQNQRPLACGCRDGLILDLTAEKNLICLQPTRVIGRKRIEKDLHLLQALLHYQPFQHIFFNDSEYKLVLHITGPTPVEHQEALEQILNAYVELCASLPPDVAERVFIEFSVGNGSHPIFESLGLETLEIEDIYKLATVILFPSETEGRGLPIIEASAGGIPIICSRYRPQTVFDEVVGAELDAEQQIKFLEFPEDNYDEKFLSNVSELLLHPENFADWREHNRRAVAMRYGSEMIQNKFAEFIKVFAEVSCSLNA